MGKEQPWMRRRAVKRSIRNCMEKKVFKTVAEAVKFATSNKLSQHTYPCPVCSHYHLSSNRD